MMMNIQKLVKAGTLTNPLNTKPKRNEHIMNKLDRFVVLENLPFYILSRPNLNDLLKTPHQARVTRVKLPRPLCRTFHLLALSFCHRDELPRLPSQSKLTC